MKKNWIVALMVFHFAMAGVVSQGFCAGPGKVVLFGESRGMPFLVEQVASGLGIPRELFLIQPASASGPSSMAQEAGMRST